MRTTREYAAAKEAFRLRLLSAGLTPAALKVGIAMIELANREIYCADGPLMAWPSVATLCATTGLSERSVQRGRSELVGAGAIQPVGSGREGKYAFARAWLIGRERSANRHAGGDSPVGRLDGTGGDRTRASGVPAVAPKTPEENIHARERAKGRGQDTRLSAPAGSHDQEPNLDPHQAPREALQRGLGNVLFANWLDAADIVVVDDTAVIEVPTMLGQRWITGRLEPDICRILAVKAVEVSVSPAYVRRGS